MKYLINKYGPEENSYYGFESDLSLEELNAEFDNEGMKAVRTGKYPTFKFQGYTFSHFNPFLDDVKILTLEDFWRESLDNSKIIY